MSGLTQEILEQLEQMKPVVQRTCELSKELSPLVADVYKRYYDELLLVGFTPEQAILIVSRLNVSK